MIDTYLLEQLTTVHECGTLSAAAEKLHLTQPSLTRSMQKLENLFGVKLFDRGKNRVTLNENGLLAAECAKHILDEEQEMLQRVRALDRSSKMITVGTISPGPMFELSPLLSSVYPAKTITTEIRTEDELIQGLTDGTYQMIILNKKFDSPAVKCVSCGTEHLYFSLPPEHRLSQRLECSFSDLNGESFLVAQNIGYWDRIIREHMPDSRFLFQNDIDALTEIVRSSTMPAFATDITRRVFARSSNRVYIPISDEAAIEHFFCICRADDAPKYERFYQTLERRVQ